MENKDDATVLLFALRYSFGRRTYAFNLVANMIINNVDNIQSWELRQMSEETREAAVTHSDLSDWEKKEYIVFAEKMLEEAEKNNDGRQ